MLSQLPNIENIVRADKKIVLSFFDHSTIFVRPWAEAGYICYCFDLQHPRGWYQANENIYCIGLDIMKLLFITNDSLNIRVAFMAFFPPCTYLTGAGNGYRKHRDLFEVAAAIKIVAQCLHYAKIIGAPYFIENPVGMLSTIWRKPDFIFQPWQYDERIIYTKRTCLWAGNGFKFPLPTVLKEPVHIRRRHIDDMGKTRKRQRVRSLTPICFSKECFNANSANGI